MSNGTRITRDRALADYLAMGRERSLKKLAQRYTEARTENGTVGNLRYWSRTHGWVERAREHDAQVAGEVSRKAIEDEAQERWDEVKAMRELWESAAARLKEVVAQFPIEDAADFRTFTAAMKEIAELASKAPQGAATGEAMQTVGASAEIIYDLLERRRKERDGDQ